MRCACAIDPFECGIFVPECRVHQRDFNRWRVLDSIAPSLFSRSLAGRHRRDERSRFILPSTYSVEIRHLPACWIANKAERLAKLPLGIGKFAHRDVRQREITMSTHECRIEFDCM